MANHWDENLIWSKYHLSIADRMFDEFSKSRNKRFLVGVIRELAESVSNLIDAFLIRAAVIRGLKISKHPAKNLKIFSKKIGLTHLGEDLVKDLLKVLDLARARKNSPIEFAKGDKILLLVGGKYKILTIKSMSKLLDSTKMALSKFQISLC
jgi:hypothetical protein